MAQKTSISPTRRVTIEGQSYEVRTITTWNDKDQPGTIDETKPITSKIQYKPGPTLADPFPQFADLADRTGDKNTNNGWSFRPSAGTGFKKVLVEGGSNSLSSQLDGDVQNQVAKDANVPLARSQQALSKITTTKTNQQLAAQNQDPNAPAGGQNQAQAAASTGDAAATPQTKAEDLNTASGKATGRDNFPNLKYPLDLTTNKQDVIKFVMLKYKPSTFATETLGFQRPDVNRDKEGIGTVFLPIPAGISDTTNCIWGSDEMTAGQIAGANIALGGITGGGAGFTTKIEEVIGAAIGKDKGVDVKTLVATQIAGSAAGAGSGLLKRVTGGALNPNLELLFDKPGLRTFGFTFKMSARSEREAKEIIGILRFFKQGMAPQKSTTNLFVKAPHTFRIEYLHKGKKHNFLNEFKECALTNLTTNYTPEGQYATFYDGPMVSYEMQMQFQELDPVFNEDYIDEKGSFLGTGNSGPDTKIGF